MGYYLRTFCTADELPRDAEVVRWVNEALGTAVTLVDGDTSASWDQVAISYGQDRNPLLAEASTVGGPNGQAREEVEEFVEALEELPDSAQRQRVLLHLQSTRTVVALQLPVADMTDQGYDVANAVLAYFVKHCGGLVQADGEGFYAGDELLLELE